MSTIVERRKKEYDELYTMLGDREKEVENANKFADSLLNDKKKLLAIIEQKDKKIEEMSIQLFSREKLCQAQADEANR